MKKRISSIEVEIISMLRDQTFLSADEIAKLTENISHAIRFRFCDLDDSKNHINVNYGGKSLRVCTDIYGAQRLCDADGYLMRKIKNTVISQTTEQSFQGICRALVTVLIDGKNDDLSIGEDGKSVYFRGTRIANNHRVIESDEELDHKVIRFSVVAYPDATVTIKAGGV